MKEFNMIKVWGVKLTYILKVSGVPAPVSQWKSEIKLSDGVISLA